MKIKELAGTLQIEFELPDYNDNWAKEVQSYLKSVGGRFDWGRKCWYAPNTREVKATLKKKDEEYRSKRVSLDSGWLEESLFLAQFKGGKDENRNNRAKGEKIG